MATPFTTPASAETAAAAAIASAMWLP